MSEVAVQVSSSLTSVVVDKHSAAHRLGGGGEGPTDGKGVGGDREEG